ncbi:PEP-CTERM sorting domain-containing protein [Cerasicoccus maritimus]|uniref:PEP-CTERM sorting domain-containing protein n=1 Tax=Cerasicoccus maritimus TaxID=490089 RepID=UPI002852D318|nr:PEP-CTERM sorting domain-containing protein [Cerasicoccus maritimus]
MNVPSLPGKGLFASLSASVLAFPLTAATVTYVGSQLSMETYSNDPAGWRSAGDPDKPLDIDSNGVLGTDGYYMAGSVGESLPGYISDITAHMANYGGNAGYAQIDNPLDASGNDVVSGSWYMNGAAAGTESDFLTITVGADAPESIRLSMLWDNTDNSFGLTEIQIRVYQTTGGTADSGFQRLTAGDAVTDWYFFDIDNAQAGDVFKVQLKNNNTGNRNLLLGGVAFDGALVPEPATSGLLMGVGAGGLIWFYRRKRS